MRRNFFYFLIFSAWFFPAHGTDPALIGEGVSVTFLRYDKPTNVVVIAVKGTVKIPRGSTVMSAGQKKADVILASRPDTARRYFPSLTEKITPDRIELVSLGKVQGNYEAKDSGRDGLNGIVTFNGTISVPLKPEVYGNISLGQVTLCLSYNVSGKPCYRPFVGGDVALNLPIPIPLEIGVSQNGSPVLGRTPLSSQASINFGALSHGDQRTAYIHTRIPDGFKGRITASSEYRGLRIDGDERPIPYDIQINGKCCSSGRNASIPVWEMSGSGVFPVTITINDPQFEEHPAGKFRDTLTFSLSASL